MPASPAPIREPARRTPRGIILRVLTRALLALAATLAALAALEGALRLTHPQYADAAGSSWVADSDLGYYRRADHGFDMGDPDHGIRHPVIHNHLGLRMHREVTLPPPGGARVLAFFGDSFMENIRLPVMLSFTEALHHLLRSAGLGAEVLNLGVDGYGPDQELLAYRRFRQSRPGVTLDHVFYLFCANDLRNIVEAGLFSLDDRGVLVQRRLREPGLALKLLRRLYLTYFLMEQGLLTRQGLQEALAGSEAPLCSDSQGAWKDCAFAQERKQRRMALREAMKPVIQRFISGASSGAEPEVRLFYAILDQWRLEVEAQGGRFHVLLLPDQSLAGLARRLSSRYSVLYLAAALRVGEPAGIPEQELFFKNDGHWNALGNMLAAVALSAWIKSGFGAPPVVDLGDLDPALGLYLAAADPALAGRLFGPQRAGAWETQRKAEVEAIHRRYTALERRRSGGTP